MSIIILTHHDESIFNISSAIPDSPTQQKSAPKGLQTEQPVSKLREEIKASLKKGSKPYGSMGLPRQPPKNPQQFLRKNTGRPALPVNIVRNLEDEKELRKALRPPVPTRDEVLAETSTKIIHKRKNHLAQNIKNAERMVPKTPARKVAVTVDGCTKFLGAGMEPKHLTSNLFGKIPPYLDNLIKIRQKAVEEEKEKLGITENKCVYITREERKTLLDGLKKNWEELQRVYQGLPILTDTIPKKQKKAKLETELKQLERDIVLIERHPYIYVYDDENSLYNTS